MKVLIDRKGLQAQYHLKDKERLPAFITELERSKYSVDFSSASGLTADQLKECEVLVITTRSHVESTRRPDFDYSEGEISNMSHFVQNGGGLLLMSNHEPHHEFDAKLAKEFDVTIECTWFRRKGTLTTLSGSALNSEHPIITGSTGEEPVGCIVTKTCCSIVSDRGKPLVSLSSEMVDKQTGRRPDPHRQFFANALEAGSGLSPDSKGRVVTMADSGFIGTDATMKPGRGLIGHGHNMRFIMNVIRWLGGDLG